MNFPMKIQLLRNENLLLVSIHKHLGHCTNYKKKSTRRGLNKMNDNRMNFDGKSQKKKWVIVCLYKMKVRRSCRNINRK